MKIPIIHLSGGDVTEGATDDAMRHAITKMSYLHFTSTEIYRKRVIQLGESPERVFNVGAIGIDNIFKTQLLSKTVLSESLNVNLSKPYLLVTFHPVTLENHSSEVQFREFLRALDHFSDRIIIFTLPNSDADGRIIIEMIEQYVDNQRVFAFTSLGQLRYLSAMRYAAAVVGNSSSGIVEAPSMGIPTVNIGDRQKGRARAASVIDCETNENAIVTALTKALSTEFQTFCKTVKNIYGDGKTTEKIMEILKEIIHRSSNKIDLKKAFYDL